MFRLPVCPHCGTIYRYGDVHRALRHGESACYHCQRPFALRRLPGLAVEALIIVPLCIGFNILMMTRMQRLNLPVLFISTVIFILLYGLLMPFFIRFTPNRKKTDENLLNKSKNTKNQQQSNKKRRS